MVPIDYFDIAVDRNGDRCAVIDDTVTLSYLELQRLSRQVAATLSGSASLDLFAAAIYSPNDYRVLVSMLGIMRAGGAIVPLHARSRLEASARVLERVGCHVLLYHRSLKDAARELVARAAVGSALCLDEVVRPEALVAGDEPAIPAWIDAGGNRPRPVFLWQTSGSTGEPKIVVDDCVCFDATLKTMRALHALDGDSRQVALVVAPMSHTAGPYAFEMLTLGATVVIMRSFDVVNVLRAIERHRVTDLWLSPTALYLLLSHPDVRRFDYSSLRCLMLGAAAVAPERLRKAVEVFGPCVTQTYGQIESGPVTVLDASTVAAAIAGDHPERLRSSGRSVFLNRVAIMSDDGQVQPNGVEGEIVVRGTSVKTYLDPAASSEVRRHGWHHTGDLGYLDDSGFLFVVGRKRDVINTSGFKIAAGDVESVIMEMNEVLECAVVAAPDAVRGEVPKAVVALRPGYSVASEAIIAHCHQRLGPAGTPVSVARWAQLPKSPAGKIDKLLISGKLGGH